jgi:rhodanese-related sulfurtransferase
MPQEVNRQRLRQLIEDGAQLVDVLPSEEYETSHLPGAINVPLARLAAGAPDLDRLRPVAVYCADTACDLSPRAAALLEHLGFQRVYDYAAGKKDWIDAGLPVEGRMAREPLIGGRVDPEVVTCRVGDTVDAVRERLAPADLDHVVVVDDRGVVVGLLDASGADGHARRPVASAMTQAPQTFRPSMPVSKAAEWMRKHGAGRMLVTSSDGVLLGAVSPASVASDEELFEREIARKREASARQGLDRGERSGPEPDEARGAQGSMWEKGAQGGPSPGGRPQRQEGTPPHPG